MNACTRPHIQSRHSHYKGAFLYFLSPAYGRLRLSYPTIPVALFRADILALPSSLPSPPLFPLPSPPSRLSHPSMRYACALTKKQPPAKKKKYLNQPGYFRFLSGTRGFRLFPLQLQANGQKHLCVAPCNHEAPCQKEYSRWKAACRNQYAPGISHVHH